eukprot:CAMPEP_0184294590 /NCGR_PEP_ID=MMETSP1049-20130417/5740_1 /TAXON_ID=77928 /ORGANISM="Proteomonas sulcata, Strain CCMP704" /LENGTH=56 /DNA_ID=CAMNT_0026602923 /DNA_START=621 /DNA_END=791 /DNA_ORIENTATION=-
MDATFAAVADFFEEIIENRLNLDGYALQDPFGDNVGTFQYKNLLARVKAIRGRLGV